MYTKYFNIFLWCWGAYGGTPYTVMLVQVRVDFKENWGGAEPKQCCNVVVEATNLHRLHPTSMSYIHSVSAPWYAVDGHMDAVPLHCYVCAGWEWSLGKLSWAQESDVVMSWLRLQTRLECISHPYHIYTVFQHLDMPWMGIWMLYPYTVTPEQGRGGF